MSNSMSAPRLSSASYWTRPEATDTYPAVELSLSHSLISSKPRPLSIDIGGTLTKVVHLDGDSTIRVAVFESRSADAWMAFLEQQAFDLLIATGGGAHRHKARLEALVRSLSSICLLLIPRRKRGRDGEQSVSHQKGQQNKKRTRLSQ